MLRTSRMALVLLLVSALFPLAMMGEGKSSVTSQTPPKLLVLVVFDQLRGDYFDRWGKLFGADGFNKLTSEGAWFTNCHYPYSMTVTGAGHATLGTGCIPAQHGIIENDWYDRSVAANVYCATFGERYKMIPEGAKSKSGKAEGGSPTRLMVPALGDYVKAATGAKGKVIGLSLKDRGGVLPAGMKADLCFWYDNNASAFVTSNYYTDTLPAYMAQFNEKKLADQWFNKDWTKLRSDIDYTMYSSIDDAPGEGDGIKQGRVFPHRMTGGEVKPGAKFYDAVYSSPMGNDLTWAAAQVILENEKLGQHDQSTDYLVVSYSSNDSVGHIWGPDSQEVLDVTLRSDRIIAEMISYLDAKVGRGNYVLALSADHGVSPTPESARKQGHEGGRVDAAKLVLELELFLKSKYNSTGRWIEAISGAGVYLNHQTIKQAGQKQEEVEKVIADWFMTKPYASEVFTRTQMVSGAELSPVGKMVKKSFLSERSGDVMPAFKPYWFLSKYTTGTTHGSPNEYDTHVPLVFFGGNTVPGKRAERVSPQLAAVGLAHTVGQKVKDSDVSLPEGLFK